MSFAATAALVALYESWRRPVRELDVPWPIRAVQSAMTWFALSLAASFVAGVATGPIAMQHFNRVATYGLAANLAAEPISTFLVMPALALGALLTPFGVGGPFLEAAGFGIRFLNSLAAWFAHLPGAVALVPSAPAVALPLALLGVLFICVWKGRLRWVGLPFAMAVLVWPRPPAPDIWIADNGSAAAVRIDQRALALRPQARAFAADLWSRRRGLTLEDGSSHAACNRNRCFVLPAQPGPRLAGWWTRRRITEAQLTQLCAGAEVVVLRAATPPASPACADALVLTARDFTRGGSAELYREGRGWRVVWAEDIRGRRPWTGPPDDGEARVSDSGG
jgi:competence protein ComEC